jgi:hypothetical protein
MKNNKTMLEDKDKGVVQVLEEDLSINGLKEVDQDHYLFKEEMKEVEMDRSLKENKCLLEIYHIV